MFCKTQFYIRNGALICNRVRVEDEPSLTCIPLEDVRLHYHHVDGGWEMGYTKGDGAFVAVARFDSRAEARKALARAQWKIKMDGCGRRILGGMIGLLLLFALLFVGTSVMAFRGLIAANMGGAAVSPTSVPEGMPLSADEMLSIPK